MPDTETTASPLTGALDLGNAVRLEGDISATADGRIELGNAQLVGDKDAAAKTSLRPGKLVTLSLPMASFGVDEEPPGDIQMRVSNISGNTITMVFADTDGENAKRYLKMLAARRPLNAPLVATTVEYAQLLNELRAQSLTLLQDVLEPFMGELSTHLLDLSTQSKQLKSNRNTLYEASIEVRSHGWKITRDVVQQISDYYLELSPDHKEDKLWQESNENQEELGLIDLEEFEDYLAVDRIARAGTEQHKIALEALVIRLATMVAAQPTELRLPVHVRQLCLAFRRALEARELPPESLPAIFTYFSLQLIKPLRPYYAALNALLEQGGLHPDIEAEIKTKGSLLESRRSPVRPRPAKTDSPAAERESGHEQNPAQDAAHHPATAGAAAGPSSGATVTAAPAAQRTIGNFSPENLYSSVIDALNFKREAEGLVEHSSDDEDAPLVGNWDGTTASSGGEGTQSLADAQTIAKVLGALQQNAQLRGEAQQRDSLREYLAENKEQLSELKGTSGLTAESLNQLDMVDNLFGTIKSQVDVTAELQPTLKNLQIPLAKLALLDPKFFMDRSHSARAVVNKLSGLATSANFPNKALEGRINHIVDTIVADYENDSSVFDSALTDIDKLVAQQERALSRNIERVVTTQDGQEKLRQARQTVNKVIAERIPPPSAPKVLIDLIDNGWRDLLVLTHIKEGPNSKAWDDHLNTLDLLTGWLNEQQQGELDDDLTMQRSLEAEPLIELIGQQITSALPTNMAHEQVLDELREVLTGNMDVSLVDVAERDMGIEPEPEIVRAKIEDLPRLRRWVKRVEQLEKDTWLTYRDKEGHKRRMQLAWVSDDHDRYIFVNERGQKIADLSAIQLARQLSRGVQPPAPADKLSVVDQSMYQTLEHVQKTLSFARNHDTLTKLINRETLLDQMARALRHAQLKDSQHAVLFLNIDQFKLVNEVYDRINGDQVLLEFARLLAQLHGRKTSSARIGGDEFAILLLDRTVDEATKVAEKIRSDIEQGSIEIDNEKVSFTVSIGIAPIVGYSPGVEKILEDARSAMHHAKELGRNRVLPFQEDQSGPSDYIKDKQRTRQDLEQALATDRFVLRAQPIVQTAVDGSRANRHYELLLGLTAKDGSITSPEKFIKSAERYGFMTLVDRWVVREAFAWISHLMDDQKVVPSLAINLSGTSVTDDSFMDYLLEQISEFGVGTSRLCFEITETGTISNLVKAADFVRAFRNIGCKFSIDDFGTGLASHNYLRELPVDYVKIDGTFVTGIHTNRNDYAMVRSINDLAHFLGQETVAESVETDEIIEKLQEIGVDYLQGWGIGHPKLLTEVAQDLSSIEK
tara:strand:+ start:173692 stop:177672 length:3981 start_codon:yes stop_codon:yes gene_type:complete